MEDFKFLQYHTLYSSEGDLERELEESACFSQVFDSNLTTKTNNHYQVILFKNVIIPSTYRYSNACLMTKTQLANHLKQAQTLYKFKFKITETTAWCEDDEYPAFQVDLYINRVPGTFHKYILTWLRYTYEFPYNVLLLDALHLKDNSIFRFTSIANLFNLVLSCYPEEPRIIHQVPNNTVHKFYSIQQLKRQIKEVQLLNDIYKSISEKQATIPKNIDKTNIYDLEYWNNVDYFEKYREPIYINTYKNLK